MIWTEVLPEDFSTVVKNERPMKEVFLETQEEQRAEYDADISHPRLKRTYDLKDGRGELLLPVHTIVQGEFCLFQSQIFERSFSTAVVRIEGAFLDGGWRLRT